MNNHLKDITIDLYLLKNFLRRNFDYDHHIGVRMSKKGVRDFIATECDVWRMSIQRNMIALAWFSIRPFQYKNENYLREWLDNFYSNYGA